MLASGVAAWPLAAHAQRSAMPVVGFLNVESPDRYHAMAAAFRQGLQESGFVDGQNVAIEYCWAEGHAERLPALAADLVHKQVTVIAATSTPSPLKQRPRPFQSSLKRRPIRSDLAVRC
jgi:ABC-type uncharacterized transport system substrate-binding protein